MNFRSVSDLPRSLVAADFGVEEAGAVDHGTGAADGLHDALWVEVQIRLVPHGK